MPIDCCHGAFAKRGPRRPWPVEQAAATSGRLAQEQHAAAVYRALAAKRSGEDREILLALARARNATPPTGRPSSTRPSGPIPSRGGVVLLDCCNSGAFARGLLSFHSWSDAPVWRSRRSRP